MGSDEVLTLAAELELLAGDPGAARADGSGGSRVRAQRARARPLADLYAAALEEAAGGVAVENAVVGEFARAADEVGLEAQSEELSHLADALRSLRRGD